MKRACLSFAVGASLAALGACASEPDPIHYTGETRRFAVDSITVPLTTSAARELGVDIDGDRAVDNQLGMVIATLSNISGNVTMHGNEMIAAGVIASSVEIVADDVGSDDTVALRYIGADGDTAELVGGSLEDGRFVTERSGGGAVHLPVFVDADPVVLPLVHMRATLVADGRGGFDATIAGAVPVEVARKAAFDGITQMFETRPGDHLVFFRLLDTAPYDFVITQAELEANSLIAALLAPDLELDRAKYLSIGFRAHLSPCAEGSCVTAPAPSCFDRVRNGDETDVDCGGACEVCASGFACSAATDCESASCAGTCAEASCSDGVRDGWETDVDCGGPCGGCATGDSCYSDSDCTSNHCGVPCTGTLCGDYELDTCR